MSMKMKLIVCTFILLVVALGLTPTPAYAATMIYGGVSPSADGYAALKAPNTGFAVAYKVSDVSDKADSRNAANQTYNGYFLYDAISLWKSWSAGDDVVAVVEMGNTESGGHGAYVASTDKIKTLTDPDVFPSCKLEKIPTPLFDSSGSTHITMTWSALEDANGNVENYSVYRSTDGATFSYAGTASHASGTVTFSDTGLSGGSFYYKLKVKFRGGYESEGFSEKSAQMSTGGSATPPPLGTTPTPSGVQQLGVTPTPTQQLGTTPSPTAAQTSGSTTTPASTTASVQTTPVGQKKNESADVVGSIVSSISNVSSGLTGGETGGLPNFILIIIVAALIAAGGFAVRRRKRKIRTYVQRKIEKAPAAEDAATAQPAATAVRAVPVSTVPAGTCSDCGMRLPLGATFCGGCGAKTGEEKLPAKEKDEQRLRVLAEQERLKSEEERKRLDKERKRVEKERQKLEKASAAKVRKQKKTKPSGKYEIDQEHLDQIFK